MQDQLLNYIMKGVRKLHSDDMTSSYNITAFLLNNHYCHIEKIGGGANGLYWSPTSTDKGTEGEGEHQILLHNFIFCFEVFQNIPPLFSI